MHIVNVYIEFGGYDYRLIKGGISVYLWNLCKAVRKEGEQVTVITALHGQEKFLKDEHDLQVTDYQKDWSITLDADPKVWNNDAPIQLDLTTKAYKLEKEGVTIYLLSNDMLDQYASTFYPPYEAKGRDTGFFKPLVLQADVIHFIREKFTDEEIVIHAHEPYYQYLLPCAFHQDSSKTVVSTIHSNMPINKKVYKPKIKSLLQQLDVNLDLDQFDDQVATTQFNECMLSYLPTTHLNYPYPENYLNFYSLCLNYSDKIDFLCEGHLEFYNQFFGTSYRALFIQQNVYQQIKTNHNKMFIGSCALSDSWIKTDFKLFDREVTLKQLELDARLPTFYHSARYAPNHKGQDEMIMAIEQFLKEGFKANFIIRCVSGTGIDDERYHQLAAKYPSMIKLEWNMQDEAYLKALANASDFALYPCKFEMDTFLIALGEAMLAGCVPIASEQLGMRHWNHSANMVGESKATGLGVVRSFLENDLTLVASIYQALLKALAMKADPTEYAQKSTAARNLALSFTWQASARQHLQAYQDQNTIVEFSETEADTENWLSYAKQKGELVSLRKIQTLDLPTLSRSHEGWTYACPKSTKVQFFVKRDSKWCQFDARYNAHKANYELQDVSSETTLFLLVTLSNGDQFWDGIEAS